jgi:hypothetical protein
MRTGFSLLIATTRPGPEHVPLLRQIAAAGYDGAENPGQPGRYWSDA